MFFLFFFPLPDLCSSTSLRTSSLCSLVFPIVMNNKREFCLCDHIYTPVKGKSLTTEEFPIKQVSIKMTGNMHQLDFNHWIFKESHWHACFGENYLFNENVFFSSFNMFTSVKRWDFCEYFEWNTKRINSKDIFSKPVLLIFIKGANNSGGHCIERKHQNHSHIVIKLRK